MGFVLDESFGSLGIRGKFFVNFRSECAGLCIYRKEQVPMDLETRHTEFSTLLDQAPLPSQMP